MKMRLLALVLTALLIPAVCSAQNASLEISERGLNRLVARLGALSEGGVYQSATPWQWWVTNAYFTLTDGSMTVTATVRSRVGNQMATESRTVPASVSFDPTFDRSVQAFQTGHRPPSGVLRIIIGGFTVPVQADGATITQVDVAKLYGVSIPIWAQELSVPLPNGGKRTLTARVVSITPQYLSGRILVNINMGF
jgi:hypothetical protein